MKMKTLAVLAASGLMAVSLAYIVPVYAEETTSNNAAAMPMQPAPSDESASASSDNDTSNNTAENNTNTANPASPTDQGTPDVPSGDDDY